MPNYEKEAAIFCDAIRAFAKSEDAINNMESYLSYHFGDWLKVYASDPEQLAYEMKSFAHMYDSESVSA